MAAVAVAVSFPDPSSLARARPVERGRARRGLDFVEHEFRGEPMLQIEFVAAA